LVLECGLMP